MIKKEKTPKLAIPCTCNKFIDERATFYKDGTLRDYEKYFYEMLLHNR